MIKGQLAWRLPAAGFRDSDPLLWFFGVLRPYPLYSYGIPYNYAYTTNELRQSYKSK
jgi:hypothetical protein